ncbi:hypothetical protein ACNKHV_02275 [Shigella flexneri]
MSQRWNELSEDYHSNPQRAKNALTKQYQALFNLEGVDLEFVTRHWMLSLRKRWRVKPLVWPAFHRESRTAQYHVNLPSMEDVEKVVMDESVIDGQSKPLLSYSARKRNRHLVNN